MPEEQLSTNKQHPIVRIGNEVHRPTAFWTPAVQDLLKHLESVGFPYSPRVLGFDEEGREVLSYFEGESGKAGWYKILDDDGLRRFAKLLRTYHDAVATYRPPQDLEWSNEAKRLKPGEIICHGDFGPWNIVWQGNEPVGIVDWDVALPAAPEHDILYAIEYSAPFRDDEAAVTWHHFPKVPDRKHRVEVLLEAYGHPAIDNLSTKVAEMQRETGRREAYLAERGIQPQVEWIANGDLDEIEKRAKWSESNSALFV